MTAFLAGVGLGVGSHFYHFDRIRPSSLPCRRSNCRERRGHPHCRGYCCLSLLSACCHGPRSSTSGEFCSTGWNELGETGGVLLSSLFFALLSFRLTLGPAGFTGWTRPGDLRRRSRLEVGSLRARGMQPGYPGFISMRAHSESEFGSVKMSQNVPEPILQLQRIPPRQGIIARMFFLGLYFAWLIWGGGNAFERGYAGTLVLVFHRRSGGLAGVAGEKPVGRLGGYTKAWMWMATGLAVSTAGDLTRFLSNTILPGSNCLLRRDSGFTLSVPSCWRWGSVCTRGCCV